MEQVDPNLPPKLLQVLESASRLQELVPGAVLVGGSAAALYAGHRESYDHDHVLTDLAERFEAVLEALESDPGFHTARSQQGKIILGDLGGIETGVRQLIRKRPLEVQGMALPSGRIVTVPTRDETLRVKGFLVVRRNSVRDFLDVAAMSDSFGVDHSADTLGRIDEYYSDDRDGAEKDVVATQLTMQLADPQPRDARASRNLPRYKGIRGRWSSWDSVVEQCQMVSEAMQEPVA